MSAFADLATHVRKQSKLLGAKPRIGVEIPGISEYIAAHGSFTTDSQTFDGIMKSQPSVNKRVSRLGGLATYGNLNFAVNNQELYSNILNTYPDLENETAEAFLYFDDDTSILDAERVRLYKGEIIKNPKFNSSEFPYQIGSEEIRNTKTIGTLITDADAADTALGLPEDSRGKTKPIIYGDHILNIGNDSKSIDTTSTINNLTPCIYLGIDSSGKHKWLVANHEVNEIDITGDQKQIWGKDPTTGRFVRLASTLTVENSSDGCIISYANFPTFYDYWYPKGTVTSSSVGSKATLTDKGQMINKNFADKGTMALIADSALNDYIQVVLPFAEYDNDIGSPTAAIVHLYAKMTTSDATRFDLKIGDATTPADIFAPNTKPTGGSYPENRLNSDGVNTPSEDIGIRLTKNANLPAETASLDIYMCYKRVPFNPSYNLPLYFGGQGRKYGDGINNRGTDNGYVEAHVDAGNEGSLIENAAGVIESLLRDETSLADLGSELMPNQVDRLLDGGLGGSNWVNVNLNSFDDDGDLSITADTPSQYCRLPVASAPMIAGRRYRLQFDVANRSQDWDIKDFTGVQTFGTVTANGTDQSIEFGTAAGITGGFRIVAGGADAIDFDNFSLKEIPGIDFDSLNVASNDLSTTVFSFAILEQNDAFELIDDILKTVKTVGYRDELDRFRVRTFVNADGFGVSETDRPSAEDVLTTDPTTTFKITAGVNNKLDFNEGGGDLVATITAGTYTGSELAAEINTQMDSAGADFTVTYSSSTGKFTIADDAGTVALLWASGGNGSQNDDISIAFTLGFDDSADDAAAASHTGDFPVWDNAYLEHPVPRPKDGDISIDKANDRIVTDVTVEYYVSYESGLYQDTSQDTDTSNHAELITKTVQHLYTRDATTAELYRDFLLDRLSRGHYALLVPLIKANMSAIGFEPWDFCNVRHRVMNGILGSAEKTTKYCINAILLNTASLSYILEVEEV